MANHLPTEEKARIVAMLCENASIRAIERMTGTHRDTIMRLGRRVGEGCAAIMDERMRGLSCKRLELDEIWGFIGAKQKTVKEKKIEREGYGDVWTWIALDPDTKLIPAFMVGKRDGYHADSFLYDLQSRLVSRPQISTDALSAYVDAIERAFGSEVDYGTIIKSFTHSSLEESRRYSPPSILKVKKVRVQGDPDMKLCTTSHVEKQNHTLRMHCRRLSRLTNAFSKRLPNHEAATAMNLAYYNFCKIHGAIRCTPAMEAGVVNSQWTTADLVEMVGEA